MPPEASLTSVRKPRRPRTRKCAHVHQRKKQKRQKRHGRGLEKRTPSFVLDRVPESQRLLEPLLASWFEVDNLAQATPTSSWRKGSRSVAHRYHEIGDVLQVQDIEDEESVNSVIKIQLHPTKEQKEKLDQMFAAQRAIYNKMVVRSCEDSASRLTSRDKKTKMTLKAFGLKYRTIANLGTMGEYFRNKRGLKRHKEVNDEVRDSAYRDFMKATKSSIADFFAALTPQFPDVVPYNIRDV